MQLKLFLYIFLNRAVPHFSAAICLLKGGHTIILNAFDFFKQVNDNFKQNIIYRS